MPRSCTVCAHAQAGDIAKAIAAGGSDQAVSDRFKNLTKSAVLRHRVNCLRAPRREKPRGDSESNVSGSSVRFESGRCPRCGIASDDPSPQALVKRAEATLARGETILDRALNDDDLRLALGSLDRVRQSLDQLLRVHGLLAPDGATTVIVNAQQRAEMDVRAALSVLLAAIGDEKMQTEALRIWLHFLEGDAYELPVIDGDVELPPPALPVARPEPRPVAVIERPVGDQPSAPITIDQAEDVDHEPEPGDPLAGHRVRRPPLLPPSRRAAETYFNGGR